MTSDSDDVEEDGPPPLTPVTILNSQVVGKRGGLVSIEWYLSGPAERWWADAFSRPRGDRSGSIGFVNGPDPKISSSDGVIAWAVPAGDIESASRAVKAAVEFANGQLETEKRRREEDAQRLLEAAQAQRERLEELQRRLDQA